MIQEWFYVMLKKNPCHDSKMISWFKKRFRVMLQTRFHVTIQKGFMIQKKIPCHESKNSMSWCVKNITCHESKKKNSISWVKKETGSITSSYMFLFIMINLSCIFKSHSVCIINPVLEGDLHSIQKCSIESIILVRNNPNIYIKDLQKNKRPKTLMWPSLWHFFAIISIIAAQTDTECLC